MACPEGSGKAMEVRYCACCVIMTFVTNDERVSVKSLEHDGVFQAEIISGQCVCLPLDSLIGIGEELSPGEVGPVQDSIGEEMGLPVGKQHLPVK